MTPDSKLDTPGMASLKSLRALSRAVAILTRDALAKDGAAKEGKLFAELSMAFAAPQP